MSADNEFNAVEEAAAGWLVERDRGLSPAREQELARWLRADPAHEATYRALAATWTLLGEAGATEAAVVTRAASNGRAGWFAATFAAAAALAVAYFGGRVGEETPVREQADGRFAMTAKTEVGAVRRIDLPDGSVIQLNTDSVVDVEYAAAVRRVRLARGEAYFTVAKNPQRPFVVSAGGLDVRVLGTVFNVRLKSDAVDVLVTEGRVRVGSPTVVDPATQPEDRAPAELTAGQRVSVALGRSQPEAVERPVPATPAQIRQTLAWQGRRLDFDATPLSEIVAEINRYNRHQISIADERLRERRFGGSFPATDHETVVRMLEADFGVVAERRGGETQLRLKTP
ncbi:MAG TPA: FecR domain-containing protein [Opitutaceae bacterium]